MNPQESHREHLGQGLEEIDTIVIGGGQAGLAVGYYLQDQGREFVILDANQRTGDSWRNRWDSLFLFTPARFNGLPGMRFPAGRADFVDKDRMADFLESYAVHFDLPIRRGTKVDRLGRLGDRFLVSAGEAQFVANNVVVAMGRQAPWTPAFAADLDPGITQLHSAIYRTPTQLQDGPVLVVGGGNSAADIAIEVARSRPTWMAGKETGHVPFRIERFLARHVLVSIVRFVGQHVLNVKTPIGRKIRPKVLTKAAPLVRVKPKDLLAAGVRRVPRVVGASDGLPMLEDGRILEVSNVIWCTGFRPGFSWIDLPILGDRQEPEHERGTVPSQPGLYFVGLHFLTAMTSETIPGMKKDAKRITKELAARAPMTAPVTAAASADVA